MSTKGPAAPSGTFLVQQVQHPTSESPAVSRHPGRATAEGAHETSACPGVHPTCGTERKRLHRTGVNLLWLRTAILPSGSTVQRIMPNAYRYEVPRCMDHAAAKAVHEGLQSPITRREALVLGLDLDPTHVGPCRHDIGPTHKRLALSRVVNLRANSEGV